MARLHYPGAAVMAPPEGPGCRARMKQAYSFLARQLGLIAIITLPWVAVIGFDILTDRAAAEAEALRSVQQRSRLVAQEADDTLQRGRHLLDFLANRPEIAEADRAACQS